MKDIVLNLYIVSGCKHDKSGPSDEPLMVVPARSANHAVARARIFGNAFPQLAIPTTLMCYVHNTAIELVKTRFGFIPEGFFEAREHSDDCDPQREESRTAVRVVGPPEGDQ